MRIGSLNGPGLHPDGGAPHQQPHPHDEPAQPVGKNGLFRVDGRPLHAVGLRRLVGQGQAGQAVGYQVNPENVNGQQRHGQPEQGRQEQGADFTRAAGHDVADELEDVAVNPAAVPHGFHNGSEVVVEQNHVGRFLRYLGAVDAHGDADVGILERGRIVYAVAGHGHELVPGLQRLHDAQLLGRVDAGVYPHVFHHGREGRLVELSQLLAGQHQVLGRGDDAQAFGHGLGRERVVAGYHDGRDAGGFAFGHGLPGLGAGRVQQAGEADETQAGFDGGGRHVGGHRGQQLGGVAQHAVALAGQRVHALPQVGHIGLLAGVELLK